MDAPSIAIKVSFGNTKKHRWLNQAPIEDLNFKDDGKIMLLIAIVVMALKEAFENGSLKQKIYRNGSQSMAASFFRQGITYLRSHA